MSEIAFLTPHEQAIYRQYDDQRRSRLARLVALGASIQTIVASFVATGYLLLHLPTPDPLVLTLTIICWLGLGFFLLGFLAAERGHPDLTALYVCGTLLAAVAALLAETLLTSGLNSIALALLSGFPIVIVIAGILGTRRLVLTITALSVLVVALVLGVNASAPLVAQNLFVILVLFAVILVTPGTMMIVLQQGFQRTLRELGDVRIAYERASALDELKNQFIINVNHELRNPVMAMVGYLDILDMSLATVPLEDVHQATQEAISAANNLRTLLASILDAGSLEQGPGDFTPERVALLPAIQAATQLVDQNEGNFRERDLRINVPENMCIWGEPVRLQQILTNLLSNAAKYSPPDSPIEVTARMPSAPDRDAFLRRRSSPDASQELIEITVRDWGLGIPPEQIPLLFQRFVRLPRDLASTVIGNGLGLYVCRLCAEAMGGRIWVESSGVEGEGAAFHLQLPAPSMTAV